MITALHGVCDAVGARVLQRYAAVRNLARTARAVSQKPQGAPAAPAAPGTDPREVSSSLICGPAERSTRPAPDVAVVVVECGPHQIIRNASRSVSEYV